MINDMYHNSTRDPKQIEEWWAEVPLANIGCDCGRSNIVAVDFDTKHVGPLQIEALKLVSGGKSAWNTRVHSTPGKGFHYIFRPLDEGVLGTNTATFGGPGIDTRDKGGYILLPPSSLAEYGHKKYAILNDIEILPCPAALLRRKNTPTLDETGKTELEALLTSQNPLKLGVRNTTLYRICCKLLRSGFAMPEARAALIAVNNLRCVPPLQENDILTIVESAFSKHKAAESLVDDAAEQIEGIWNDNDQATAVNVIDFLREQKEETLWLVEGLFPLATLNMVQGDAKAGKSTLTRHLAVAAACGGQFLGLPFSGPVPVLYYSLQENKKQWKGWLERTLRPEFRDVLDLDIIFRLGKFGPHAVKGLRQRLKEKAYKLVVIDMIPRFLSVKDLDKYAEMEAPLSDLNDVAEESGACIIWLHHERKSGGGFEAGIGSQAIRGSVYTTVRCVRDGKMFNISSEQREGDDMENTGVLITENGIVKSKFNANILAQALKKKR